MQFCEVTSVFTCFIFSSVDVCANMNVGRLLGRRMLEAGITNVVYDDMNTDAESKKVGNDFCARITSQLVFTVFNRER